MSDKLSSMLKVDFRRMFTMRYFYIILGVSFIIPILVVLMTNMMDGTVTVNRQTGEETVIEGYKNTWQVIGTSNADSSAMTMDMTSMLNINMVFFIVAVLECIFVSEDFRSGFSKLLFVKRAKKKDYIISKTIIGTICGAFMIIAWLIGTILAGAIAGLSFDFGVASAFSLIMCLLGKILLMPIFVSIFLLTGVIAKNKLWMSMLLSLFVGMFFFMIVPMVTPLDSSIANVFMCAVGGILFSIDIGVGSNRILSSTDLV